MLTSIYRKSDLTSGHRYFVAGVLASVMASPAVLAAATAPALEEIIVTSSKRDLSLQQFSGAASVLDKETLQGLSSISDIARRVPGLATVDTGPRNPSALMIRGLRFDTINAGEFAGDGATVASYFDNIPLQGYYVPPSLSLKDLQQVEVLRGPQGTLYGNASIAGLVRYVSAKPQLNEQSLEIGTRLSNTRHSSGINHDTDIVVNTPLIEDTLAVRMVIGQERNQGFIDSPFLLNGPRKDSNDDRTDMARVSALWQLMPEWQISGSYHYQKTDISDRQAANPTFTGDEFTASTLYREPVKGDLRLASLESQYQFPGATLTASISRYDYETVQRYDQTHYLLRMEDIYEYAFFSDYDAFSAYTTGAFDVVKDNVEIRLVSDSDQRVRWLGGLFYTTDDLQAVVTDTLPGFAAFIDMHRPDQLDYYATQRQDLREQSAYAEVAWDIIPQWEISAGLRYFHYKDDVETCSTFPISLGIEGTELPVDCLSNRNSKSDTLGKISTRYAFNDDQSVYFSIAEGFRRGGANLLPVDITEARSYAPDSSVNYELGNHSYLFDRTLRLSAALFYIDWQDIQLNTLLDSGYGVVINAPEARAQGVELEAQAQLNAQWRVRSAVTFTDAELSKDVADLTGYGQDATKGDRLPGAPRYQWTVGVDYQQSLDWGTLDASLNIARKSGMRTALNDNFEDYLNLEGYTTADADISVSRGNWRAGLFIHNISDTRAITGQRTAASYGEQGQFEYMTRPRTAGVSLRVNY
jgi:iron complex outermembrane receptor protein